MAPISNYAVYVVSQLTERFWRGTVDAGSEEEAEVAGMRNWKRWYEANDPTLIAAAKAMQPLTEVGT
jgi:predicted alpha/beta hydrolase